MLTNSLISSFNTNSNKVITFQLFKSLFLLNLLFFSFFSFESYAWQIQIRFLSRYIVCVWVLIKSQISFINFLPITGPTSNNFHYSDISLFLHSIFGQEATTKHYLWVPFNFFFFFNFLLITWFTYSTIFFFVTILSTKNQSTYYILCLVFI